MHAKADDAEFAIIQSKRAPCREEIDMNAWQVLRSGKNSVEMSPEGQEYGRITASSAGRYSRDPHPHDALERLSMSVA